MGPPDPIAMLPLLALGLLVYWLLLVSMTAWRLSHPPRRTYGNAIARGLPGDPSELDPPAPFEPWELEWRGHQIPGWTIDGDDPQGPTLVLVHGWGDGKVGSLPRFNALRDDVSRCLVVDLPGHGESTGPCSLGSKEAGLVREIIETKAPNAESVVLFGWSLGAGVCLAAANGQPSVAAVIAESPYIMPRTPAERVLRQARLPWLLNLSPALWSLGLSNGVGPGWRGFDRTEHAARIRVPVLYLHGSDDAVCPPEESRTLADRTPSAILVEITGGGHNNLWTDPRHAGACTAAVRDFLRDARSP